ncbi:hypothetical protein EV424DRAFT_1549531, partial [Suillus variegatus]
MALGRPNKRPRNKTGLTSSRIRHVVSHRDRVLHPTREVLGPSKIAERAAGTNVRKRARTEALTADEKRALEALREQDDFDFETHDDPGMNVLDGSEPVDISHAGGEFHELTRELLGNFYNINANTKSRRPDYRTRHDRTQQRTEAFDRQMPALTKAYLDWHLSISNATSGDCRFFAHHKNTSQARENTAEINGSIQIKVVDVFCAEKVPLTILSTDSFIASALVRQGIIPSSPISPTTGSTVQALKLYHTARQRNPHFSIQAYVKTLCDLQGVQFYAYLSRQFSIALDVYLQILTSVNMLVDKALRRGDPHWRLKHACPACTYKLQGEVPMKFSLLYAMDGNDSLKRVLKKSTQDDLDTEDNSPLAQRSSELPTTQVVRGDCYLLNEYIEQFARDSPADMLSLDDDKDNPCAGCWKNMQDEKTKKMWGVFDESGIFMSICRHGFSLVIADMVQSGEQAKYPLAVVSKLLDTFGSNLGGGYDIGCRFKTTLSRSSLGQRARELNHTSLVEGISTDTTHQRLCQLDNSATYVDGIGLEDPRGLRTDIFE